MSRTGTNQNESSRDSEPPATAVPPQPTGEPGETRRTYLEPAFEDGANSNEQFSQSAGRQSTSEPVEATPFRPLGRPPMAVLCALDDGFRNEGETWRIRKSQFVIGRSGADAVIPHDPDISARHAQIGYRWQDGCYCWHLKDLRSTNGTFIRVSRVVLRNGKEILLGGRRFQFLDAGQPGAGDDGAHPDSSLRSTRNYQSPATDLWKQHAARLAEVNAGENARSYPISEQGGYVGSDGGRCAIAVNDDPFVDPVHARAYRDAQGRYVIEDNGSRNGLWLRIQSVDLSGLSGFQLGEQRFTINIL